MNRTHYLRAAVFTCLVFAGGMRTALAEEAESMLAEEVYRSLVAERKATRVGDVLTVIVQESASASSSADLRAERSFSIAGNAAANSADIHAAEAGISTESQGLGRTQRSGRLLAQISVRVIDVTESGGLVVSGQQRLQINREQQIIKLSGVVRPHDISDGNIVLSSRIADARIEFDGKGFVARETRPGWIAWFLSFLGL